MTRPSPNTRAVLLSALFLVAALAGEALHAADAELLHGSMVLAPASDLEAMAAGAVEDTLLLCLRRIPLDASAGQRLLAEQSCAGEERARNLLPDAMKF